MLRVFLLSVSLAYVMPAYSILKRLAAQRDEHTLTGLKLEGLGGISPVMAKALSSELGTSWASGELSLGASWSVRYPGRCRLELTAVDTGKAIVSVWNAGKKRSEGPAFPAAQVAVDALCPILSAHSATDGETRASIEKYLTALKVDTKQVALGRFAGATAFILGERKDGAPQFWVYKDRFLPARLRLTDESGTWWDVRLLDYTSQATADWFPRVVEVYQGNELHLRVNVLSADTRPNVNALKF